MKKYANVFEGEGKNASDAAKVGFIIALAVKRTQPQTCGVLAMWWLRVWVHSSGR